MSDTAATTPARYEFRVYVGTGSYQLVRGDVLLYDGGVFRIVAQDEDGLGVNQTVFVAPHAAVKAIVRSDYLDPEYHKDQWS